VGWKDQRNKRLSGINLIPYLNKLTRTRDSPGKALLMKKDFHLCNSKVLISLEFISKTIEGCKYYLKRIDRLHQRDLKIVCFQHFRRVGDGI
jgi:hypothetical protein